MAAKSFFHQPLRLAIGLLAVATCLVRAQTFTDIGAGLPGVSDSPVPLGDYDNDGRLDILLTGFSTNASGNTVEISQVWRNTGVGFTNIHLPLPVVSFGWTAWGDYNNDGRLDFVLTGTTNSL